MRNIVWFLSPLLVFVTAVNIALAQDEAKALARGAFYSIEEKPFDSEWVRKAIEDIKRAEKLNPKEPWVAIATSRALLEIGYEKGDRYSINSFSAEAVEKAEHYARQGVLLGPAESIAYCQLARIQIILKDYPGALDSLNHADQIDKNGFYSSYLRAVIAVRVNNKERAKVLLDEADKRADQPYQRRFVLYERIGFAQLLRNRDAEEDAYKKIIELYPQDAHGYGNYGNFLLLQKRYDEAIANLEKAISIHAYPLAEEQLRRARLLRNSASK